MAKTKRGSLYEVDSIVGMKKENDQILFKIRWTGYDNTYDSWEPESSLINCNDAIKEYTKTHSIDIKTPGTILSSDEEGTPKVHRKKVGRRRRSNSRGRSIHQKKKEALASSPFPHQSSSTPKNEESTKQDHLTMDTITPSRYYLRHSTVVQRPPMHSYYLSSDEEGTPTGSPVGKRLSRRELHQQSESKSTPVIPVPKAATQESSSPSRRQLSLVPPKSPPLSMTLDPPPWMQLGWAEMLFCLVILGIVLLMVWIYQENMLTSQK